MMKAPEITCWRVVFGALVVSSNIIIFVPVALLSTQLSIVLTPRKATFDSSKCLFLLSHALLQKATFDLSKCLFLLSAVTELPCIVAHFALDLLNLLVVESFAVIFRTPSKLSPFTPIHAFVIDH